LYADCVEVPEEVQIVIVDDDPLVRQALRVFTEGEDGFEVVGEACDGVEAVDVVRRTQPDVVLMDLRLPAMSGVVATKCIVSRWPTIRVLAVTTLSPQGSVVPALRSGASGYSVKDIGAEQIVRAIWETAKGQSVLSPAITGEVILSVLEDPECHIPSDEAASCALTERELSLVQLIAKGHSSAEIAEPLFLSGATVKSYLQNIMHKWQVRDRVQVLIRAASSNLVTLTDSRKLSLEYY